MRDRGPTITFNVLDRAGHAVPFWKVEDRARDEGVSVRGGCFCNAGASEAAFGFRADEVARCRSEVLAAGFSVQRLAECLGPAVPVGAIRASLGLASNAADVERTLSVIQSFAAPAIPRQRSLPAPTNQPYLSF
jgi:selenocysteine lyase/cysteine desulfurase